MIRIARSIVVSTWLAAAAVVGAADLEGSITDADGLALSGANITVTGGGIVGIGANCGANLADTEAAVAAIRSTCGDIPVVSKANAGIPVWKGDVLEYDATPEILSAHAHRLREAGISVIGGCCGSTPEHISHIRGVLDGTLPVPDIAPPTATAITGAAERVEREGRRRRRG